VVKKTGNRRPGGIAGTVRVPESLRPKRRTTPPGKTSTAAVSPVSSAAIIHPSAEEHVDGSSLPMVVGVGASAGGLEAFTELLSHLPGDTGMAFVLIQHLDPSHESHLAELLSKASKMPVSEAKGETRAEANHVYVIPPRCNLGFSRGVLRTSPRPDSGRNMPIDSFLRALAADQGSKALGVVLSGTASDGTLGLQAIKAAGGITFAQEVRTAKYEGMPRSAIAAAVVDYVLPPAGIARQLAAIARASQVLVQPPEPDEEPPAGAGAAVPEVVISCHRPPAAFRPLPLFWPGAVSPTKVYSGCPSKVAWTEPSARLIVLNVPVTPAAVTCPVTGGQFCAHVPLHFDVVDVSGANEYSVKPLLLVSTVTPAIVAVFTVPTAAAGGLLALLPEDEGEEAPAELHATRAVAAATAAGSARSIRKRAGLLLIRCALPLPPRPGFFRVVMTSCPLCRVSPISSSLWFLLGNWRQKADTQALLMLRNTAANIVRQMSSATTCGCLSYDIHAMFDAYRCASVRVDSRDPIVDCVLIAGHAGTAAPVRASALGIRSAA